MQTAIKGKAIVITKVIPRGPRSKSVYFWMDKKKHFAHLTADFIEVKELISDDNQPIVYCEQPCDSIKRPVRLTEMMYRMRIFGTPYEKYFREFKL